MDNRLTQIALPVLLVFGLLMALAGYTIWRDYSTNPEVVYQAVSSTFTPTIPLMPATSSVEIVRAQISDPITVSPHSPRLLFVGDIMLDRNVARRMQEAKDPSYPFRRLPPGWFETFDYAIANLEGPVTDKRRAPEKSIDFQFDPSVIPMLKVQGIDAVSQANNHALDQGAVGYADSVRRLREAGFLVFGHQVQDDDIALATTTIRGKTFAFLGFNTTDNPLDRLQAESVIQHARKQADYVIVYMHWGAEYAHTPIPDVVNLAHWFIDQGVDVVMGGHPHWVQGIERYKEKPIVYSLGNFVFDQDFSSETKESMAMELQFDDTGIQLKPIPLVIEKSQPTLLEDESKNARLRALASYSATSLNDAILAGRILFP